MNAVEEPTVTVLPPAKFDIADAYIAELKDRYASLRIVDENDEDGYEAVKVALRTMVSTRTALDKNRKAQTQEAREWIASANAEADRITRKLLEVENPLAAEKKRIDDIKQAAKDAARLKAEEDERERLAEIERREKAIRDAEAAERKKEADKLAAERKAHEEEMAAFRRQKEELEAAQAKLKADQDEVEKAKAAEARKAELAKAAEEAAAKAERDLREKLEKDRVAAEQKKLDDAKREQEEAERLAEMRPDVERVHTFAKTLAEAISVKPACKTKKAKEAVNAAVAAVQGAVAALYEFKAK